MVQYSQWATTTQQLLTESKKMGNLKITKESFEKTFILGVSFGIHNNETSLILDLGTHSVAIRYTRKTK